LPGFLAFEKQDRRNLPSSPFWTPELSGLAEARDEVTLGVVGFGAGQDER